MTITYHSGKRLQGTSTDFGTDGAGIPAVSGGWKELARTTLGSTGDIINVTSIPDKRYYMVLMDEQGATLNALLYLGSGSADTSENYSVRRKVTGNTEFTDSTSWEIFNDGIGSNSGMFTVGYISNLASKEKLFIATTASQETAGADTAPKHVQHVGKWRNTSNVIDYMRLQNWGTGDFSSGAEMVVLGWDPDDTHTDNFWEPLASGDVSSVTNASTGTITAKKYLWIQCWMSPSSSAKLAMQFNNDTGANYCRRLNTNGTETEGIEDTQANISATKSVPYFYNGFVVNNSANEKLLLGMATSNTAGANAPDRQSNVNKWTNTSAQITEIDFFQHGGGTMNRCIFKVWGHD